MRDRQGNLYFGRFLLLAIGVTLGGGLTANAALQPILNNGFEANIVPDGTATTSGNPAVPAFWTRDVPANGGGDVKMFDPSGAAYDGVLNGATGAENNFYLAQYDPNKNVPNGRGAIVQVASSLQSNTTYTLTGKVAQAILPFGSTTGQDIVSNGDPLVLVPGAPRYGADATANPTPLSIQGGVIFRLKIDDAPAGFADTNTDRSLSQVATSVTAVTPVPSNNSVLWTITYTTGTLNPADVGLPVYIQLGTQNNLAGAGGGFPLFDDITLDAPPVPEPAALGLLTAGTLLALGRRRHRAGSR